MSTSRHYPGSLAVVAALVVTTAGAGALFGWAAYLLLGAGLLDSAAVGVVTALVAAFAWLLLLTAERKGPR